MELIKEEINLNNNEYIKTDFGIIPKEWDIKKINEVCQLINGRGFKPFEWKETGLPIIRIQNLNGSDDYNYYEGNYDKKIEVENGQLLFAWSGSRGTSFGPHIWNGEKGLLNYHTWKINIDEQAIVKDFFLHSLKQLTKSIENKAHGASALVHTQKGEMEEFEFACPKDKKEQQAIATALSDTDDLIHSLDQLIAKKKAIKEGAMQELLTGRRRLAGFSEEWEEVSLKEILESYQLGGNYSNSESENQTPLIKMGNIGRGVIELNKIEYIEIEKNANETDLLFYGDILFNTRNTLELVGKVSIWKGELPNAYFNSNLMRLKFKKKFIGSNFFINYLFNIKSSIDKLRGIATGTTSVAAIYTRDLLKLKLIIPKPIEQLEISKILTEIDSEITYLKLKLNKLQSIKQGMMQELLTGKTRLI